MHPPRSVSPPPAPSAGGRFGPRIRRALAVLGGLLIAGPGCKQKTPAPQSHAPEPSRCSAQVVAGMAVESESRSLPPDLWYALILGNFDRNTQSTYGPPINCAGKEITVPDFRELAPCDRPALFSNYRFDAVTLDENRLEEVALENGDTLVWIQTNINTKDEAIGPIAHIVWGQRGLRVQALGWLAAHRNRLQLRLLNQGPVPFLVAESERCHPVTRECVRELRMQPMTGTAFLNLPKVAPNGHCFGAPVIKLREQHTVALSDSQHRLFSIVRSLQDSPDGPVIQEQLTIEDFDPNRPDLPKTLFRKSNLQRLIVAYMDRIQIPEGLWERTARSSGQVRPDGW